MIKILSLSHWLTLFLRISVSENYNEIIINGTISIQENSLIAQLEYSDNFEVSFEFKAFSSPSYWHEIIVGKFFDIQAQILIFNLNLTNKIHQKRRLMAILQMRCLAYGIEIILNMPWEWVTWKNTLQRKPLLIIGIRWNSNDSI